MGQGRSVCLSSRDALGRAGLLRTHGREDVVHDVDLGVHVDGTRKRHTLLLAARQVDALLADLGLVATLRTPHPARAA